MDGDFGGINYGNLDGSTLGVSLESTGGSILGIDEGIKLGSHDDEFLAIIVGDEDEITLFIDEGT